MSFLFDNFRRNSPTKSAVMKKVLFGLMGENEKFLVIDKWFTREDSFKLLNKFLEKDYKAVESEMKKPQPCT